MSKLQECAELGWLVHDKGGKNSAKGRTKAETTYRALTDNRSLWHFQLQRVGVLMHGTVQKCELRATVVCSLSYIWWVVHFAAM